ncbi:C-terminal processing protease CtpA/Prc, contains a PDZ domain [Arachidicoccus rhizosphaerae]|uniref:C-terminal processing protease CtpA/Prc, contains a PDZ domain n=1 Tax=Arachidicoccus rhizosphaerae TaxID=551991 RepID=A0A1H4CVC5_9BACT|nr:S41 family peptidase [Arachidicoccus rhizosphaerae]SEA64249.1 C-terminal processing protease CtpA/Prc, contains a PDZ domain [Arachidicoccus rhizosphaerae]
MKRPLRYSLLLMTLLILVNVCSAQQLSKHTDKDLFALAKVWGLMKYYDPAVSAGRLNWDSVLLHTEVRPVAETVRQWQALAATIGRPTEIQPEYLNGVDSVSTRNFNMAWIHSLPITPASKKVLNGLWRHPKNIGTFYSRTDTSKITYNSDKEKTYQGFSTDQKLLELFRAWNVIEYFYPYKYLMDSSWDQVLKKYIPVFKRIQHKADYDTALQHFTAEIKDAHVNLTTTYLYSILGAYSSPFIFQLVGDTVVVTGIKDPAKAKQAGVRVGDLITRINHKPVPAIIATNKALIPASNDAVLKREAYSYLFSCKDSIINIAGRHADGSSFKADLPLMIRSFNTEWDKDGIPDYELYYKNKIYKYAVWDSASSRLRPGFRLGDIAYIDFASMTAKDVDSLMTDYKDTKGLVFDLRGYTDNGALLKVFDYLFRQPQQFGIKDRPDFASPGRYIFEDNIINADYKYIGKDNPHAYKGQVVVLINEYTQSAMEMFAMIFKRIPGVIFIGSHTAGADGNKTSVQLTDGNKLYFSGLGIYYPDGSETQRVGIRQDISLRPTLSSIRQKSDLLLQEAFKVIDSKKTIGCPLIKH